MNGLINRMFALDTNTAINFINEKIPVLPECEDGETQYCISVITEIELFAYPKITPDEEQAIRSFLEDVTIIPLTDEIKRVTIFIRRSGVPRPKLPDAIIAATAIVLGASLITRDGGLLELTWPGLTTLSI